MKPAATLFFLLLLAVSSLQAQPDPRFQRRLNQWESEIESTKQRLRDGEYEKADRLISGTIDEVCNALTGGDEAARMIGLLLTLRALGEAGSGREQDALWSWQIAQQFEPQLARTDLSEFGPPSALLAEHRWPPKTERAGDPETAGDDSASDSSDSADRHMEEKKEGEITPPKISRKDVKFPRGALWSQQSGEVEVLVTIGADGSLSNPQIKRSLPNPALTLTALESMKNWKIEPGRVDGEPVPVFYNLRINYTP